MRRTHGALRRLQRQDDDEVVDAAWLARREPTDGRFIPAEHIVQFVDKAAYTLRGSFSRHHRETIELDSMDED